jgi:hypothetical protein
MAKEAPIINALTARLDGKLARQIYSEYQNRLREVTFLLSERDVFISLRREIRTIEILLALSIFNKRVIANFDAAVKFHITVSETGDSSTIRMGGFDLDDSERRKLSSVALSYRSLMKRFQIPEFVMTYETTWEFLQKIQDLKRGTNLGQSESLEDEG